MDILAPVATIAILTEEQVQLAGMGVVVSNMVSIPKQENMDVWITSVRMVLFRMDAAEMRALVMAEERQYMARFQIV